jgi:hypothetical protein
MVRAVVDQVAPLAEAFQVAQPVVARIMIEMRGGEDDTGLPHLHGFLEIWPAGWPTAAASPRMSCRIEPAAIRQASDGLTMRPAAAFTGAPRPLEADAPANLPPVDRIEPSQFTLYWHGHSGFRARR